MRDPSPRTSLPRRFLSAPILVALTIAGCSPDGTPGGASEQGDGPPRLSLKERRAKQLEKLQKKPASD